MRAEVPDAVAVCKRAGITVRMVTGDNTYTAQHIARECGILNDDGIALEGPDFRNRSDEELKEVLPSVQVRHCLGEYNVRAECRLWRLGASAFDVLDAFTAVTELQELQLA